VLITEGDLVAKAFPISRREERICAWLRDANRLYVCSKLARPLSHLRWSPFEIVTMHAVVPTGLMIQRSRGTRARSSAMLSPQYPDPKFRLQSDAEQYFARSRSQLLRRAVGNPASRRDWARRPGVGGLQASRRAAGECPDVADIVAKVPAEPPGQGNSAIIESERPVL